MKYTIVCEKEHLFVAFFVPVKLTRSPYGRYFFITSLADTCVLGATQRHHFTSIDQCLIAFCRHQIRQSLHLKGEEVSVIVKGRAILPFSASEQRL